MKVKNSEREFDSYQTKRQWALQGCMPAADAKGVELWTNSFCQHKAVYYSPDDVAKATAEQLAEFFKPEKERKKARDKRYRLRAKAEKLRAKAKKTKTFVEYAQAATDGYIVIDTETTGLDDEKNEILQVSIIDNHGNVLFDSYFKPIVAQSWIDAERVNHISPEMVKDAPCISDKIGEINEILSRYNKIIGYNIYFDTGFLKNNGAMFREDVSVIDVMEIFAEIYGEWSEYHQSYKWQKLTTAADYYKYDWNSRNISAHNSLADCYATLYVYEQIQQRTERINKNKGKTIAEFISSQADDYKFEIVCCYDVVCPRCYSHDIGFDSNNSLELCSAADFKANTTANKDIYNKTLIDNCVLTVGDEGQEIITITAENEYKLCCWCKIEV